MKIKRFDRTVKNLSELTDDIFDILVNVYGKSPWSKTYISEDLQLHWSRYFLAMTDENQPIGFLAVSEMMDEMEITNLAVCKDFQRQGISTALFNQLSFFSGNVFLEVRAQNFPAQELYKKQGFTAYHIRKNYYTEPADDAILMRKIQN
ncbi:ribosomal protein S18-alanine N-acetyltransferase [Lactococcus nasutitermitis]|uniref:[Ribosomal protein bS18]-alanine N-acetyltransferase n=1 Tax=Lactococcus nasutitermitis TaxID=1652957 RepID=A0ABV9JF39_9LACT|nr:ribosomal protein S18-alanine N-acetyltransferase [Lactococcus nasutitermitis]